MRNALSQSIRDAGLVDIVGRNLQFYTIPDNKTDKALAHFAGNMRQHLVIILQLHLEHCSGQNGTDSPLYLLGLRIPAAGTATLTLGNGLLVNPA